MESEANLALAEGLKALEKRDLARASMLLRTAAEGLPRVRMNWVALANTEIALGNRAQAETAIEARLEQAPREISSLLLKGLLRERAEDPAAAVSFYRTAATLADGGGTVEPDFSGLLGHARQFVAQTNEAFSGRLIERFGSGVSPAISEAIEILTGKRQLYFQEPTVFYYPGLPQKRFYDPAQFAWFEPMLALLPAMQAELQAVLAGGAEGFAPYIYRDPNRPAAETPLLENQEWTAFHFWRDGKVVEANAARCPATMEALSHVPLVHIPGRCPNAHWSRLLPGAHITPHVGMLNTRLICHIPILTAPACWLRVGSERREWLDGVPLVFDDSIEHEARNEGPDERVVLLFEIWRPEVEEADRDAIARIFEMIGEYS